jgi:hypothetical protein
MDKKQVGLDGQHTDTVRKKIMSKAFFIGWKKEVLLHLEIIVLNNDKRWEPVMSYVTVRNQYNHVPAVLSPANKKDPINIMTLLLLRSIKTRGVGAQRTELPSGRQKMLRKEKN